VLVAGSTVVISMLGLFAMGLSFMRGAAVVTILAVLVVMARRHHAVPGAARLPRPAHRPAPVAGRQAPPADHVAVGGHIEPRRRVAAVEPAGRAAAACRPPCWAS
jgi:RND superfamily putative drug exporter